MSFDVYVQRFRRGEAVAGAGTELLDLLRHHASTPPPDTSVLTVAYGDGTADVYPHDDAVLVNHVTGDDVWELLVQVARAADAVILPVGCPTCLTRESQGVDLPDGLRNDAVLVSSGAELRAVLARS